MGRLEHPLVLLHFLWLYAHFAPASMTPDANGYLVQARLGVEADLYDGVTAGLRCVGNVGGGLGCTVAAGVGGTA